MTREAVTSARRVVVKVGSSSLPTAAGGIDPERVRRLVDVVAATEAALAEGVWLRPFRDLVYTMPPYVTSPDDLATLCAALVGAVEEVHG